jgi:hypothetical protein
VVYQIFNNRFYQISVNLLGDNTALGPDPIMWTLNHISQAPFMNSTHINLIYYLGNSTYTSLIPYYVNSTYVSLMPYELPT